MRIKIVTYLYVQVYQRKKKPTLFICEYSDQNAQMYKTLAPHDEEETKTAAELVIKASFIVLGKQ